MSKEYAPHQLRVVEEKTELDSKINKLTQFIFSGDTGIYKELPEIEKEDLTEQLAVMTTYSHILAQRIERF